MNEALVTVPIERIARAIFLIRGEKVMLDRDLAALYGVSTKVFNQAVKLHNTRFPPDFMFQLTMDEAKAWRQEVTTERLRSQIVTLKRGQLMSIDVATRRKIMHEQINRSNSNRAS